LTLACLERRHKPPRGARRRERSGIHRLHNVHCVTFVRPRGRPQGPPRTARGSWHECCFSYYHPRPQPEGRRRQGITERKCGFRPSLPAPGIPRSNRITTRTTLLHTQASDRHPAQAGFFLGACRRRCPWKPLQSAQPVGARARGAVRCGPEKVRGGLEHPMKFRLPCSTGIYRSATCEISWGPRWAPPRESHRFCQS